MRWVIPSITLAWACSAPPTTASPPDKEVASEGQDEAPAEGKAQTASPFTVPPADAWVTGPPPELPGKGGSAYCVGWLPGPHPVSREGAADPQHGAALDHPPGWRLAYVDDTNRVTVRTLEWAGAAEDADESWSASGSVHTLAWASADPDWLVWASDEGVASVATGASPTALGASVPLRAAPGVGLAMASSPPRQLRGPGTEASAFSLPEDARDWAVAADAQDTWVAWFTGDTSDATLRFRALGDSGEGREIATGLRPSGPLQLAASQHWIAATWLQSEDASRAWLAVWTHDGRPMITPGPFDDGHSSEVTVVAAGELVVTGRINKDVDVRVQVIDPFRSTTCAELPAHPDTEAPEDQVQLVARGGTNQVGVTWRGTADLGPSRVWFRVARALSP